MRGLAMTMKEMYNTSMSRILSGIRPSGVLHIGNYFGALQQWIALQKSHDVFYMVADLHAITTPYDPKNLQKRIQDIALDYLAAGLDPKRSIIFVQSHIPEHTELAWLLNTITPLGELQRMTQYKEKAQQHASAINAGLLNYPVLMAADILIHKADLVPVGEDQVQHVELARVLARKFNVTFGETFPEPKTKLTQAMRIMSLTDPTRKMAKSDGEKSYIALTDSPETIKAKLAKAVTATRGGGENPGARNLLTILRECDLKLAGQYEKAEANGTIRYADLKADLANALAKYFAPFREKRESLAAKPNDVQKILAVAAARARKEAEKTMKEVRKRMGLR